MTDSQRDAVTIIVIAVAGGTSLMTCLQSVTATRFDRILMVNRGASPDVREYARTHDIQLIETDEATVPERRAAGVRLAASEWVAIIEDSCSLSPTWESACLRIVREPGAAGATGPVRFSNRLNAPALALACAEYGRFTSARIRLLAREKAVEEGLFPVSGLVGLNLLYRRRTILPLLDEQGLIESELDAQLIERGHLLLVHAGLSVEFEHAQAAGTLSRFHHGRLYGGLQARKCSFARRLVKASQCSLLPFILTFRAARSVPRGHASYWRTFPIIALNEVCWSFGELTGYLSGPGNSIEQWR